MEENYRKRLIKILTFLGGLYFFVEFILPKSLLEKVGIAEHHTFISYGFIVVGSMAVGLGIINLFMVHGSRILFRRKDWFFSLVLLLGLIIMMSSTIADWQFGSRIASETRSWTLLGEFTEVVHSDHTESKENVPPLDVRVEALLRAITENGDRTDQLITDRQAHSRIPENDPKNLLVRSYFEQITKKQVEVRRLAEKLQTAFDPTTPDFTLFAPLRAALDGLGTTLGKFLQLHYEFSVVRQTYNFLFHGLFVSLGSA
ncbi:MAG: hypothetical protein KDD55_09275, partial [Bdellovibrionales bacterium]|nr:hypothetical protein [Bdellovibrionales bacterium]